jgi:RNA-directed DNA polymerase
VLAVLGKRFERFGLKLHPDKTRLLPFRRPPRGRTGGGPGSFDFLGFTVYWMKDQAGRWRPALKTRKARLRRAIVRLAAWCRSHRHDSVTEQSAALGRRIEGHFNYFGVNGNMRSLRLLIRGVEVAWRQALSRRGQRRPVTWKRFRAIVRAHPLPEPSIRVQVWATS